jgi:hypothetical protein
MGRVAAENFSITTDCTVKADALVQCSVRTGIVPFLLDTTIIKAEIGSVKTVIEFVWLRKS